MVGTVGITSLAGRVALRTVGKVLSQLHRISKGTVLTIASRRAAEIRLAVGQDTSVVSISDDAARTF